MTISLIVATAAHGVIGARNTLPWHLPEDLKHFRALTMGHPIIMGRKTWESLPRALPGRRNLVVSRQHDFAAEGAEVFGALEAALAACVDDEVFVIGGATLYAQALPLAHRLYRTEIDAEFPGDTFFPPLEATHWREISREAHTSTAGLKYAFVTLERTQELHDVR